MDPTIIKISESIESMFDKCPKCGSKFASTVPNDRGHYDTACINPECHNYDECYADTAMSALPEFFTHIYGWDEATNEVSLIANIPVELLKKFNQLEDWAAIVVIIDNWVMDKCNITSASHAGYVKTHDDTMIAVGAYGRDKLYATAIGPSAKAIMQGLHNKMQPLLGDNPSGDDLLEIVHDIGLTT